MRTILVFAAFLVVLPFRARADDCERIAVWRDGRREGSVCRANAAAHGLTVIDLGDGWVPPALAAEPDGTGPSYRSTYLALAQERFSDAEADVELAPSDRYFELYGIEPSLGVVRARLADDARHLCHDAIDDVPLATAPARIIEEPRADALARITIARTLRTELEHNRDRKQLADLDALAAADPLLSPSGRPPDHARGVYLDDPHGPGAPRVRWAVRS